jgi:hypothetical protein
MPTTHLTTEPLTVGSPEIGTVSLGVVHVLQAEPLTIGMPPTGVHQLKAAPMRALSRAKFTIELIRPPLALVTASPQIGTPAVGQIHVLRAEPLHTEPPEIVERRGVHRLHVQPSRRTRKSTAYMVDRCRTVLRERLWPERFPTREELPHRHYLKMAKHALKSDPRTRNLPLDRMRKTIMRAGYRER